MGNTRAMEVLVFTARVQINDNEFGCVGYPKGTSSRNHMDNIRVFEVLLSTARVHIEDKDREKWELLDNSSQSSFLTEQLGNRLNLPFGIGNEVLCNG